MITEAHNYTLIDTWIYGMGNECNTGMKGQYTLATHTGMYPGRHAHTCKTTHARSHCWGKRHVFLSGCKVNVKCLVGNDDVRVQSCKLDGGAPYGSLRPCHYLVTPLTFIRGVGGWERQTIVQLKLSGVNSAIITLKCQPAIKYNSSSGRKQISFDQAVITLSCRTIRRDQIFTFSVWGKAIRVHFTWQGCTFAILQG